MNAAYLLLDERTTSAFDAVAQDLVSKSAFERVTGPAYVVVLNVSSSAAATTNVSALKGHCLEWQVTNNALRVLISFAAESEAELVSLLKTITDDAARGGAGAVAVPPKLLLEDFSAAAARKKYEQNETNYS